MKRTFVQCCALAGAILLAGLPGVAASLPGQEKAPPAYTIQMPPQPDYSPFTWLLGDWTGKTGGKGVQGEVLLSFSYELGKRFMVLREEVSLPASKNAPATHESLMGILSATASGGFEMTLYSSSGFVSRYAVTARSGEIDLQPDGGSLTPPGWLFRRVFRQASADECQESVTVAPPQRAFFTYYTAALSRITPAPANTPSPSQPNKDLDKTGSGD